MGGSTLGGASSRGGISSGGISTATGGAGGQSTGGNVPLAPTDLNIAGRAAPRDALGTPLFGWVPNDPDGNEIHQTESASTLTTLGPEDHRIVGTEEEKQKKWRRLQCSIGKPLPDVRIKIVDDEGKALQPNEPGEILAKGPRIMKGYWGDEQKTAQTMTPDGWLRTGDLGYLDDEGYVYLTGRADDLIIRGGENIAPEEVEEVISTHPKIAESCVIAVPDEEFGQQPFACCVLKEGQACTPDEVMAFCKERIAGFKRPKGVVFINELPRNPMGKVLRKKLRDVYGQE